MPVLAGDLLPSSRPDCAGQPQTDLPGGTPLDATLNLDRRHGRRLPGGPDPGGGLLQSLAGHSLQYLRLHLPDAGPVAALTAAGSRPPGPLASPGSPAR